MWIVDSSVWIDYFNGVTTPETELLDGALGQRELGIGDLTLCEVLQGFREDGQFTQARDALLRFPLFPMGGGTIAIQAAHNYRGLRRRGLTVRKTIDCLIATFCIEEGYALLHSDRDYELFADYLDLQVVA